MKNSTKQSQSNGLKAMLLLSLFVGSSAFLVSCEEKGPLEKAGEDMDDAIEETGDAVEDATN